MPVSCMRMRDVGTRLTRSRPCPLSFTNIYTTGTTGAIHGSGTSIHTRHRLVPGVLRVYYRLATLHELLLYPPC